MASRSSRKPHRAPLSATAPCPCGTGLAYGSCCGPFHTGAAAAPTAEALMRSRYTAFALLDEAYLLRTWQPAQRPPRISFDPGLRWTGLEIVDTGQGSAFHTSGTVAFRASYEDAQGPGVLTERSRFERSEGAWVYVDGVIGD